MDTNKITSGPGRSLGRLAAAAATWTSILALGASALAQTGSGSITGRVTEPTGVQNLAGAQITVRSTGQTATTSRQGRYVLMNVPAGSQDLSVSFLGYPDVSRTVVVDAGTSVTLDITMGDEVVELAEMEVVGERAGQARALNLQRASENLMNVVASDAIGQFPDQNAAEALQRLPGVSIERDQGEGRYVVLRGIDPDLNNISVDGVMLSAPESDTRKVALDVVPTDLVEMLEVNKTITPDMDGDAIGGNINIRTKSPFDREGRIVTAAVQGQYNGLVDKFSGKVWGSYGDLLDPDGKVGLMISATYQSRELGSDNAEVDGAWEEETSPTDGNDYYFAPEIEFREYVITRERYGLSASLEYRPDEDNSYYVRGLYSYFSDQEYRYRTEIKFEDGDIAALGEGTATVIGTEGTDRDVKDRFEEQEIYTLVAGGENRLNDWTLDYALSTSYGEEAEPDRLDSDFSYDESHDMTYEFAADSSRPVVNQVGGTGVFEAGNFEFNDAANENNRTDESEWSVTANARYDFELSSLPSYLKFGAKYRGKDKENDGQVDIYEWDSDSDYTLADVGEYSPRYDFFVDSQGRYLRPNAGAVRQFFQDNFSSFERQDEDSEIDSAAGDYRSTEDVTAGYLMFGTSWQSIDLIAGGRYEQTDFTSTGNEITFNADGDLEAITPVRAEKDYGNFLPGLHLRYEPMSDLVVRGSWSQTLARPKFSDSAYRREVNREDEEVIEGNPLLDPYLSNNFDLSAEYYLKGLGAVSAAFFFKDISDFVFTQKIEDGDVATGYDLYKPLNGESADVTGVELAYQQQFTFLPEPFDGIGLYGNVAFISSSSTTAERPGEDLPFLKQSDTIGTLALSYQKGPFFARLSGTFRTEYLDAIGSEALEDEYVDDHFQVDLTMNYRIGRNVTLFAEFMNLNNEPMRRYFGVSGGMVQYEVYDWSSNFGVKWNL